MALISSFVSPLDQAGGELLVIGVFIMNSFKPGTGIEDFFSLIFTTDKNVALMMSPQNVLETFLLYVFDEFINHSKCLLCE
jgi:hypothetical protein